MYLKKKTIETSIIDEIINETCAQKNAQFLFKTESLICPTPNGSLRRTPVEGCIVLNAHSPGSWDLNLCPESSNQF